MPISLLTQLDPNLPDGEYRAVVFAETLIDNTKNSGSGIGVIARVATTVYVTKGNQVANLIVGNSSFDSKKQLRLLLQNQGSASVRPAISWQLKQGTTVVRKGITQPFTVIASSERNLLIESEAGGFQQLAPGNYELSGELIWMYREQRQSKPFKVPVNISGSAGGQK